MIEVFFFTFLIICVHLFSLRPTKTLNKNLSQNNNFRFIRKITRVTQRDSIFFT